MNQNIALSRSRRRLRLAPAGRSRLAKSFKLIHLPWLLHPLILAHPRRLIWIDEFDLASQVIPVAELWRMLRECRVCREPGIE